MIEISSFIAGGADGDLLDDRVRVGLNVSLDSHEYDVGWIMDVVEFWGQEAWEDDFGVEVVRPL